LTKQTLPKKGHSSSFSRKPGRIAKRNRRQLLLELLEDRRLLAFTDLAVIDGHLFYDLQPSNTQKPIVGETVKLYVDSNNNGVYDAGTDQLTASKTTDANGYYRFDHLVPEITIDGT